MFLQYLTRQEFLLRPRQPFQFIDHFIQAEMLRVTQWAAAERRETGSQHHSVVRVLRRIDDFLFHATRGFVHHQKDQPPREIFFAHPQPRIVIQTRRNIRALGTFRLAVQSASPLCERLVSALRFTLVFVKAGVRFAAQHLTITQPEQNRGNMVALPIGFLKGIADIDANIDADFVDQS